MTNKAPTHPENISPAAESSGESRKSDYFLLDLGGGVREARIMGECLVKHNGQVVKAKVVFVFEAVNDKVGV